MSQLGQRENRNTYAEIGRSPIEGGKYDLVVGEQPQFRPHALE